MEAVKDSLTSLHFISAEGIGKVEVFNSDIYRIIHAKNEIEKGNPFSVIREPQKSALDVKETNDSWQVISDKSKLSIDKSTGQALLSTLTGKIISKDALPVSWIGTEGAVYKTLMPNERFIGLGEKVGPLDRRGTAYSHWNTDKFAYDVEQDPLYLSTPFYIGLHDGLCYGVFINNTHKSIVNFGASTERFSWFCVEDGNIDYFYIYGDTVAEIIEKYTWLTGRMELPPKWSLGYQQCRYSYYPDKEVMQVATTFRDKKIPCDVVYLDIHYMDSYKAFTFDKIRFPSPEKMIKDLDAIGIKTAVIVDPGIKVEHGYGPYDSGIEEDVFVKYVDGINYMGEVWPGESNFPDFTSEKVRDWWGKELQFYTEIGVKGIWNDMNEPAAWGQCLPGNILFDYDGQGATHRKARNVYGMQMARATAEGVKRQLSNERPFVLTRAGFSGVQRYSAVWTGDNVSSDEHMMLGVRLLNSMGLTGIPFAGNDIGGFAGEATPALFARWVSIGAFQPFFRAHSVVNSRDAEPWCFGEEVEQISRNYINLRYQLMPYIYSCFYTSSQNGIPVVRSLAIDYSHDEKIYDWNYQHQFMLGESILVAPVESTKELVKVWLPHGTWYDFWTDNKYDGGQEVVVECPIWRLPVFIKGGSVIPMQSIVQSLSDKHDSLLRLHVYPGESQSIMYEDDGVSYDFEKNDYHITRFLKRKNSLEIKKLKGAFNSEFSAVKMYLHGEEVEKLTVNEEAFKTEKTNLRFIKPISGIDTFFHAKGDDMRVEEINCYTVKEIKEELIIKW